ncbi:hypothetical protein CC2G_011368 [Coprinopsis cinerea AmutBmut pab1-1]|nr:hypothetical protein CC2G_011368 [Coprinopsis cinerea AmutBmut pab1-1]
MDLSPVSTWVLFDNDDPLFVYEGEWETNPEGVEAINRESIRAGPVFNYTSRWTRSGGSVSVTFQGNRALLQGTTNLTSSSCSTCPTWTCSVDGQPVPSVAPSFGLLNNQILCDSGRVLHEWHTLTLNVTGRGDPLWVDFFRYTPTPIPFLDPPLTWFVDPLSRAVEYDSSWTNVTGTSAPNRMTNTPGAQLDFYFIGSSAAWYGIIPGGSPSIPSRIEWSIDRGPPTSFLLSDFPETNGTLTNQFFFKTPQLPHESHRLRIVYHGNSSSVPLALDHFIYEANGNTTGSEWDKLFPTDGGSQDQAPARKTLAAAQIGGIVGGVVAAAVIIFLLLACMIRRRRKSQRAIQRQ